jgi:rhamnosyl/mannosyltransferase
MECVVRELCEGERARGIDSRALVAGVARRTMHEILDGVPVTRAGSILRAGSVWFAPALIGQLANIETDILVLHEPNPMALLAYAIVRPNPRLILWYHSEVLRPRWRYELIYAPFLSLPLRRAARIVVSSPALLEQAAALAAHRRRCEVIPFGLDIDPSAHPEAHDSVRAVRTSWTGCIVLFVGRLVHYKGVGLLLRALRHVEAAAVVIGSGPLAGELGEEATRLGIASRTFFLGNVDDQTLSAWYGACDVFVLPSVTRAEAFGLVQLEAMARGKPVISTRLPTGVPWVNVDGVTGLTVPPDDEAALGAALEQLICDARLRDRLGAAGRRYVDEFSRSRMIDRTEALYASVLAEPARVAPPATKRIFDVALAGAGLLLSAPLWAVTAALIKLEDGGPVFFRQERVGQNGTTFTVLKFRSMVVDAEKDHGPVQASAGDSRVTRIGRLMRATAMDELPQLVNIFKGDMSFVGPRALRPGEIEALGDGRIVALEEIAGYRERTAVQPGLTGVAQIYAPRDVARRHKFRCDRVYVRRRSFWLDIRLILLSVWISMRGTWEHRQRKF